MSNDKLYDIQMVTTYMVMLIVGNNIWKQMVSSQIGSLEAERSSKEK